MRLWRTRLWGGAASIGDVAAVERVEAVGGMYSDIALELIVLAASELCAQRLAISA